ncbi:MAG: hypothetical protein IKV98_02065 [Clostridia bacterium]|nr:hypothetical protein [Clostridia bacterium]
MDFRKKLKTRLYISIVLTILGTVLVAMAIFSKLENNALSPFGVGMMAYGIANIKKYFYITSSEEKLKKQQIMETDERNISIANKAKSITFTISVLLAYLAVIVLSFFNMHTAAEWITYSILALIVIYLITYAVIRKKS